MTQARELSCLHVQLEETGDQKRESPTHWGSPRLSARLPSLSIGQFSVGLPGA